jgi:hypothetical protein
VGGTVGGGEGADPRSRCAGRQAAPDAADGRGEGLLTADFDADFGVDEWHGTNAFFRDGDRIFRTSFINERSDEAYVWWNLHDEYDETTSFEAGLSEAAASQRGSKLRLMIAHVGGVPLEEILPTLAGAGTGFLVVRAWLMVRLRRRRAPGS